MFSRTRPPGPPRRGPPAAGPGRHRRDGRGRGKVQLLIRDPRPAGLVVPRRGQARPALALSSGVSRAGELFDVVDREADPFVDVGEVADKQRGDLQRSRRLRSSPRPAPQGVSGDRQIVDSLPALSPLTERARSSSHQRSAALPPVGAENPVTSCDLHVLVEEAAEPVSSEGRMVAPEGGGVRPAGGR